MFTANPNQLIGLKSCAIQLLLVISFDHPTGIFWIKEMRKHTTYLDVGSFFPLAFYLGSYLFFIPHIHSITALYSCL